MQQIFQQLLEKIGFEEAEIQKEWLFLEKAYSGKKRFYHNLSHIENMMHSFFEYQEKVQLKDEILYAIFYHDIVYKATSKNNEKESAEYALKILPNNHKLDKNFVFEAIMATKHHQTTNEDIKWMIDFDLKILGTNFEDYLDYAKQIRKEYAIYPDFMYNPGRKKALQHFLEKETIYQTKEFKFKYEEIARNNISKEISLLI